MLEVITYRQEKLVEICGAQNCEDLLELSAAVQDLATLRELELA